jgi:hypothetical protein
MEEFYLQGDIERSYAMPISKFMDRQHPQESQCHQIFERTVVRPVFQLLCQLIGAATTSLAIVPNVTPRRRVSFNSGKRELTAEDCDGGLKDALRNIDYAVGQWEDALLFEQSYSAPVPNNTVPSELKPPSS